MDFKNYFAQTDIEKTLVAALTKMERAILASVRLQDGWVVFKLPRMLDQLVNIPTPPQAVQTAPQTLAAHYHPPGTPLNEGLNDQDPYGKGGLAWKNWPGQQPQWKPNEITAFKSGLQKNIQKIGRYMGFLFELEIFIDLVTRRGLTPTGENEFAVFTAQDANTQRKTIYEEMVKAVGGNLSKQVYTFVQAHAHDVTQRMIDKAAQLLQHCHIDIVEFKGGNGRRFEFREDPADIKIGCNEVVKRKKSSVGFSTKFSSESKMSLGTITLSQIYRLVGGNDPDAFQERVRDAGQNPKAVQSAVLKELLPFVQSSYENNPTAFTKLLNYFISGGHHTFPSYSLYTRSSGGPEWSNAIRKDFIVSDNSNELRPKNGADVRVQSNPTYIKITYKAPDGSPGTIITLEPKLKIHSGQFGVHVKVNNFAS